MRFKIESVIKKRRGRGIGVSHRKIRDYSSLEALIVRVARTKGPEEPYIIYRRTSKDKIYQGSLPQKNLALA